ncbi:MAG: hypothetical protein ACKVGY_06340 [Candidatus Poseidoniales archaeon]|jgi:hypothetical protein|tara:strand:+ start:109 stop:477 length:369 start_codon:yes stop_codon:yes gene_type:complete
MKEINAGEKFVYINNQQCNIMIIDEKKASIFGWFLTGLFVFVICYFLWMSYYFSNFSGIYILVDIIIIIIIPGIYIGGIIWGVTEKKSTSFVIGMLILPLMLILFILFITFVFSGSSGGTWN